MDKVTVFKILTIYWPELIANIYVSFLIIGEIDKLKINKKNIKKLLLYLFLATISVSIIRTFSPNIIFVMFLNIIFYTLIIKFVYKMSWGKSSLCVFIIVLFILLVDLIYIVPYMAFINETLNTELYGNDTLTLIYSIPSKVIHVIAIILLWNSPYVYVDYKKYMELKKYVHKMFFSIITIMVIIFYIIMQGLSTFSLILKILSVITIILIVYSIYALSKIVTYSTRSIRTNSQEQMKEVDLTYDIIADLIIKGKTKQALRFCKNQSKRLI